MVKRGGLGGSRAEAAVYPWEGTAVSLALIAINGVAREDASTLIRGTTTDPGPIDPDLTDLDDNALLAAIGRGDSRALGALYDRYSQLALAVAYRVVGERGAAEDTVQDAFLALWRRIDSFDPNRGSARAWLLTIVRNAAVDRRRGRHGRALLDAPLDTVSFRLTTDREETFSLVASRVESGRIREMLASLPVEQREAVELAYFLGLTHQEIARRTGVPLGTIKGRLRLGLIKLRVGLEDLQADEQTPPVRGLAALPRRAPGQPVRAVAL